MKNDTPHELDIEMPHVQGANGDFPDYGKGFEEQVVQGGALAEFFSEFRCFGFELAVIE
jgi:hypothetical protein